MFLSLNTETKIAVIGAIHTLMLGGFGCVLNKGTKKCQEALEKAENRAELRIKENALSMKLASANMSLSIATAMAVRDGNTNGRMHGALVEAESATKAYQDFVDEIVAQQISK